MCIELQFFAARQVFKRFVKVTEMRIDLRNLAHDGG
jgi:hypothetical protein